MTTRVRAAAAVLVFLILATANAGGYRYGVSDQAFHVPALAHELDPSLFPRDATLFAAQTTRTVGYEILEPFARSADDFPALFLTLYVMGTAGLALAALCLARAIGASSWAAGGVLLLFTLRHRIARTGANSLEGYMNPRMLAFAFGIGALGAIARRRLWLAAALAMAAAIVHPTTGLWFGSVVGVAAVALFSRRWAWVAAGAVVILVCVGLVASAPRMDDAWLRVFEDKDYLFPLQWPAYAWVCNLLYPVVVWMIYRRRRMLNQLTPGESALIAGLFALVAGFLLSLPLTALNIAIVVQLQVNRVFWVLDAVALLYLSWWLLDDVGVRRRSLRLATVMVLAAASLGRGIYILAFETHRPLIQATLPASNWNEALLWIRTQPKDWQVLAAPGHAARYGTSVRVGALHDTVLEQSKDSSTSIYDRTVAMRVAERIQALGNFDSLDEAQLRALGHRFDAQLLVWERERRLNLPAMYENSGFVVYDLR